MDRYLPVGNEMIALPKINERTAGIEDLTFLSMQHKGIIEIRGRTEAPLIQPFILQEGQDIPLTDLKWERRSCWLPSLTAQAGTHQFSMTILPPIGQRGFAVKLSLTAGEDGAAITWGMKGCWDSSWHCINEDKPLDGASHCYQSGWNNSLIFDFRCGAPMFAFAPMSDLETAADFYRSGDNALFYTLSRTENIAPGQTRELTFYWGLGYEEVAAATSAKEMLRRGWDWLYQGTVRWLERRLRPMPTARLAQIYNTNLFFCIFYSTGVTLDTEELVCATSRGTRYYVSAAYWDRDVLLWAFPAILDADPDLAQQILHYVFGRQRRNLGIHSRYIDGTVLEPGFELDELMAPVIALEAYVDQTGHKDILEEPDIQKGISQILKTLETMRHPSIPLYETFLQPTDDEIVYPYLTYNNVLVWRTLQALAKLYPLKYGSLTAAAEEVKAAIYAHCVFHDDAGQSYFGWSVDLQGHHNVYDEPPGSLQLLPYYGFCSKDDEIWRTTVSMIRSPAYAYSFFGQPIAEIGCAHAPYPWVLSLCNSLLCGYDQQAFQELEIMDMDNGIACESVHPVTGTCMTGAAFATCAGFLCHSMKIALEEGNYAK